MIQRKEPRRGKNRKLIGKTYFLMRCILLYAACAFWCLGCGAEEKESNAAAVPVMFAWWGKGALGGGEEQPETEWTAAGTAYDEKKDADMEEGRAGAGKKDANDGRFGPDEKDGTEAGAKAEMKAVQPETPLLEQLFTYEIDGTYWWIETYAVITGISEEYRDNFWVYMEEIRDNYGSKRVMLMPSDINGVTVRKIADGAFAEEQMAGVLFPDTVKIIGDGAFQNCGLQEVVLPENLEYIGAQAFENCNLSKVAFPDQPLAVGERAFADNAGLWSVLAPNVETEMEKEAFAGCASKFLLCYGTGQEERQNKVLRYAEENSYEAMAVLVSKEPVVNYHEEPLVLRPEVRNFFYGDDGDYEKDQWCTWEEDVNAPNFGYSDWQWSGCSSWCACLDFEADARASSELASADGRYAAENVLRQNREAAWAEGAEGPGIGESITYFQSCTYSVNNPWEEMTWENREPIRNGIYSYTEICIVNGYAKNQKTWEENGRIKRLAMYVEGQLYAYLELEDTMLPQYFLLPEDDIIVLNRGMLEVRFEIEEVYPGTRYDDTCLTGLVMEFSGRHSH